MTHQHLTRRQWDVHPVQESEELKIQLKKKKTQLLQHHLSMKD